MARLIFGASSIGGIHISNAVKSLISAKNELAEANNLADTVTQSGAVAANLETGSGNTEFLAAVGSGADLYAALAALQAALDNVSQAQLMDLYQGG